MRVTDVPAQADRAVAVAEQAGGDVLADQRSGTGRGASARLTLEVPPNSLEAQLGKLAALGQQVDRTTNTQDVTASVVDVTSRLSSMRASLARVRALFARASSISDVVTLESELSRRQSDLESLEARQPDLSRQTARARIDLHLLATHAPPPRPARAGAGTGFARGWHAFVVSARWTVGAFGTVLPFLLVAAGLAGLAWWLRRRTSAASPRAQRR